jgi:hypothetical protein
MSARHLFVTMITMLSLAACASPPDDCKTNDTRPCLCPGGTSSSQTCSGGGWGACVCGGNPGGPDAGGGPHGNTPDAPPQGNKPKHGDICKAPDFDCGTGTNLVCVVDQQGDTQGVCRLACGSFSDCLQDSQASSKFDTDCCDIGNGSQVCGQSSQWPSGACH